LGTEAQVICHSDAERSGGGGICRFAGSVRKRVPFDWLRAGAARNDKMKRRGWFSAPISFLQEASVSSG